MIDNKMHNRPLSGEYMIWERQRLVAADYVKGLPQADIAKRRGVTQACISKDLKAIKERWLRAAEIQYSERVHAELERIDQIELEMLEAWEKSKLNAMTMKRTVKKALRVNKEVQGKGKAQKEVETTEMVPVEVNNERLSKGQVGDPRFMALVLQCREMRCKLLGIPKSEEAKPINVFVGWDNLLKGVAPVNVEEKIREPLINLEKSQTV